MFHIRTTRTGSSSTAVQVVKYSSGKTIIIKHIGSASRKDELVLLKHQAQDFVEKFTGQRSLFTFSDSQIEDKIIQSRYARSAGFKYTLLRQLFTHLFHVFTFDNLHKPLLTDLIMVRIVNHSSKLAAITYLKEMFDISYSETQIYRELPSFSDLKEEVEKKILSFAKKHLNFTFTVVFYDVTTLYFETFKEDKENFKKPGFSKDNKFNQPQIVI